MILLFSMLGATKYIKAQEPTLTKNVMVIIYNPIIESEGGKKLTELLNWNDPDILDNEYINTLKTASHEILNYQITERKELDDFPAKTDGFKYTDQSYLDCWHDISKCHSPDRTDYYKLLNDNQVCEKVNEGKIDELWIWGGPWFGYHEAIAAGPGAFWTNANPLTGTNCTRLLHIMGFSYHVGFDNMMENFGHRVESTMWHKVYGVWQQNNWNTNWNRFTTYNSILPDKANCGTIHGPPNHEIEYIYWDTKIVKSYCKDWDTFPNFSDSYEYIGCEAWNCNKTGYFLWWFSHLPHTSGVNPDGKLNNWWRYYLSIDDLDKETKKGWNKIRYSDFHEQYMQNNCTIYSLKDNQIRGKTKNYSLPMIDAGGARDYYIFCI